MRNLCLAIAFTLNLAMAAYPATSAAASGGNAKAVPDSAKKAAGPVASPSAVKADTALVDTAKAEAAAAALAPAPVPADTLKVDTTAATETLEGKPASADVDTTMTTVAPAALANQTSAKSSRPIITDYSLVAKQYVFGVAGQAVAGALGFFIGSALETAIVGEEEAQKGTLSFTGIRYDNGSGAFWGASIGSLVGSSLTVYFTGQSDEEDGSYLWTTLGTAVAGTGALFIASAMGVNDDVSWTPYIPLLAIPTAGGVLGFQVSRWFSDRKRESIMGPDSGIRIHPPRLAWIPTRDGDLFQLQALNLTF